MRVSTVMWIVCSIGAVALGATLGTVLVGSSKGKTSNMAAASQSMDKVVASVGPAPAKVRSAEDRIQRRLRLRKPSLPSPPSRPPSQARAQRRLRPRLLPRRRPRLRPRRRASGPQSAADRGMTTEPSRRGVAGRVALPALETDRAGADLHLRVPPATGVCGDPRRQFSGRNLASSSPTRTFPAISTA